jgi:hypothetical protein
MLSVVEIRQRLAQQIKGKLYSRPATALPDGATEDPKAEPWKYSRHPWKDFFGLPDTRQREHLAFVIGFPSTDFARGRQRPSEGLQSDTSISIRWCYRLRAAHTEVDTDSALAAEQHLVALIKATPKDPGLTLVFRRLDRPTNNQDLAFLGEILLTVNHYYPLV